MGPPGDISGLDVDCSVASWTAVVSARTPPVPAVGALVGALVCLGWRCAGTGRIELGAGAGAGLLPPGTTLGGVFCDPRFLTAPLLERAELLRRICFGGSLLRPVAGSASRASTARAGGGGAGVPPSDPVLRLLNDLVTSLAISEWSVAKNCLRDSLTITTSEFIFCGVWLARARARAGAGARCGGLVHSRRARLGPPPATPRARA